MCLKLLPLKLTQELYLFINLRNMLLRYAAILAGMVPCQGNRSIWNLPLKKYTAKCLSHSVTITLLNFDLHKHSRLKS